MVKSLGDRLAKLCATDGRRSPSERWFPGRGQLVGRLLPQAFFHLQMRERRLNRKPNKLDLQLSSYGRPTLTAEALRHLPTA